MKGSDFVSVKCPHCGFVKSTNWGSYELEGGFGGCYKCHRRIPITAEAWADDPDLKVSFKLARKKDLENAKADELAQKMMSGQGCSNVLIFGGVFVTLAIKFCLDAFSA